jgi:hypothetical protein
MSCIVFSSNDSKNGGVQDMSKRTYVAGAGSRGCFRHNLDI